MATCEDRPRPHARTTSWPLTDMTLHDVASMYVLALQGRCLPELRPGLVQPSCMRRLTPPRVNGQRRLHRTARASDHPAGVAPAARRTARQHQRMTPGRPFDLSRIAEVLERHGRRSERDCSDARGYRTALGGSVTWFGPNDDGSVAS
jgi:hypothetical protein